MSSVSYVPADDCVPRGGGTPSKLNIHSWLFSSITMGRLGSCPGRRLNGIAAKIFHPAGIVVAWHPHRMLPNPCRPGLPRPGGRAKLAWFLPAKSIPGSILKSLRASPSAGRGGHLPPTRFGLEISACASFDWPTHLAVRVVSRSSNSPGKCSGWLSVRQRRRLLQQTFLTTAWMDLQGLLKCRGLADILRRSDCDELGHLPLGSNSH